ncbi:MAG: DoxX family protein [Alphaproteobacteria bacterium]|nr:DoxX family protein [Alphaproteobacteria bacterium]
MSFSEAISPFLGRCILIWFYMTGAMNILNNWQSVAGQMDAKHVPLAPVVLLVVLIMIFLGCLALLLGWQTRHGAVMLFALTVIAAVVMHDFWNVADPAQRAAEFGIFARDWAIAGGLLLMVGMGPGPFAIDNRGAGGGGGKRR